MAALCPLCNCPSKLVFEKYGYPIHDCEGCGHRFAGIDLSTEHVKRVYSGYYFLEGGAGYNDYTSEASLLVRHGEFYGKLLQEYTKPGTVLDIGAAAGFILKGLQNTGWQGDGIEPNATMVQYGRDTFGLNLKVGSFEDFDIEKTYDLVNMIQVVAHFYDFNRAMQAAYNALNPNGYLLIETWDFRSLPARILGEGWHEYSPPSVVHWFSEKTLNAHLAERGFRHIATGKPRKYIKSGHVKSLLEYKLSKRMLGRLLLPAMRLIPNNITVRYPTFDLFWSLYQRE